MGVAADLTPRQRNQLQLYKEQGKVAYYKNGRLHMKNNRLRYRQVLHNDKQYTRTMKWTSSLRKESSHVPNVIIISTTTTMIGESTATTRDDIARKDTAIS